MIEPSGIRNLRQNMTYVLMGMELSSHVFFTPNDYFWDCIKSLTTRDSVELVDCGCGMGILIEMAKAHGVKLQGVDISRRVGQHKEIKPWNATAIMWHRTKWPLICRPDHSGWHNDVIVNAQRQGAHAIYVGLRKNYERDLRQFRTRRLFPKPVGVEGEELYIIQPLKRCQGTQHEKIVSNHGNAAKEDNI